MDDANVNIHDLSVFSCKFNFKNFRRVPVCNKNRLLLGGNFVAVYDCHGGRDIHSKEDSDVLLPFS